MLIRTAGCSLLPKQDTCNHKQLSLPASDDETLIMHAHHCQSSHPGSCTDPLPCSVTQTKPFQSIPTKLGNVSLTLSARFLKHSITAPAARHVRPLWCHSRHDDALLKHAAHHLPCISFGGTQGMMTHSSNMLLIISLASPLVALKA